MELIPHFIDGERRGSNDGGTIDKINPVTGEKNAEIAQGGESDADLAVASCRSASEEWAAMDPSERGQLLWRFADAVEQSREQLAEDDSLDAGKPMLDCVEDVNAAVKLLRFYAGLPDKVRGSTMQVQPGYAAWTEREPYGVIAAIVPWNYPLYNACAKVGGIIAMGNACILKPAEQAPSSAVRLGELAIQSGIIPGVLNVLNGDGRTGALLSGHDGVEKISFTGSTETGRKILEASAKSNLKPCVLELGGKSPNLIFADADLDVAAEAAAFSIFYNQGQTCTAATRVLVESAVAEEFTEKLVRRAQALKIGDPADEATQLGPVVSQEQLEKVMKYIEAGQNSGAELRSGGRRLGDRGFFIEPTVFAQVPHDSSIATEEIFGPVASVIPFESEDDAVTLSNAVSYGLAASIWTQDVTRMHRLSRKVKAGIVWGNCLFAEHPSVPVGGYRQSGFGKEYGLEAGYEYTREKSIWLGMTGDTLRWTGVEY
ncbi:aldehyde dehydrogenase family protein [Streptomyces sp. NPDC057403]|uniref:aldehyde dehydrogenase family protein n=1 Tax=Streptomyces sp. NPDC057403 TaxID=3346119 RepID=UPI0036C5BA74